ncbi:hypothetical protein OAB00_01205 [Akkermansiaceae bacterium]|nr:hypothetical protein [Akkermansiaceae bacterium]
MKFKLNKAEFDALSEDLKKEYNLEGDEATLNIEGGEDVSALKRAKDHEKEARQNAEKKLKEADQRAAQLQKDLEAAGGNKDEIKKIQEAHKAELDKLRDERAEETKRFTESRNKDMIEKEASEFANSHFIDAPYGSKFIASQVATRLSVEESNGQPVVRVLDANGNASTASLDDLKKEFLDNTQYSPIIKGKAGSGGGATPGQSGGATTKKLSDYSMKEQIAMEKENPEGFAALIDAE